MEKENNALDISVIDKKISKESEFIDLLFLEINKKVIGQQKMIERLLIGLLGSGHVLLEGLPGLAKTLAINTLSKVINGSFNIIQFTPDLLPSDVIGTLVYNIKDGNFNIKKGPIFANFILADEINRAPAKVQSALLEAMQENQVTIGDKSMILEKPFIVLATQNPVDQEGTYPLPEAQTDRFMLKVLIDYPSMAEEKIIMKNNSESNTDPIKSIISIDKILKARKIVNEVYMDEK